MLKSLALAAAFACLASMPAQAANRCTIPDGANAMASQMAQVVNQARAQLGRGQLTYSATLSQAAQGHACDMAVNGFFSHDGSNGSSVGQRVRGAGYRYCNVGENLTYGAIYRSAQQAMNAWLVSPGHLANLRMDQAQEFGIGLAGDLRNPYWVLILAKSGC